MDGVRRLAGALGAALLLGLVAHPAAGAASGRVGNGLRRLRSVFAREGETGLRRFAHGRHMHLRTSPRGVLVPVILEPWKGASARAIDRERIQALGVRVDAVSDSFMRVLVRPDQIPELGALPDVRLARAPAIATAVATGFGPVVSESVALTGAAALQQEGVTGAGVKVAVVDLGFQGLSAAEAAGELPADTVGVDFTGTGLETGTPHGTAVAEELVDMAPGVQLYCLKVGDEVDLENAAAYLRSEGIRVANHSVAWVLASYYDDSGPINTIIDNSHDQDGVFWTVAAGNAAHRHWRGPWSDPDGDGFLNFSPTTNALPLKVSDGTISVFLNWNQYGDSVTNLDLYVLDGSGQVVASSTGPQDGPQEPAEYVSFPYDASRAPYSVAVAHVAGTLAGLDVTLFSFDDDFAGAVAASSVMDPADAHGAFSVGAVGASVYSSANAAVEPYSSEGPTTDGRLKPDLVAPDGTSTFTYGMLASYGTSFAAPVAAGDAALLLQTAPPSTTPTELARLVIAPTRDLGSPGTDPVFGAGELETSAPGGAQCGIGYELVFVIPPLTMLYNRRRGARRRRELARRT